MLQSHVVQTAPRRMKNQSSQACDHVSSYRGLLFAEMFFRQIVYMATLAQSAFGGVNVAVATDDAVALELVGVTAVGRNSRAMHGSRQ